MTIFHILNELTHCSLSFFSPNTANKRSIFDQFGEEGLKRGGGSGGSYTFTHDPRQLFAQFFGGQNPFEMFGNPGSSGAQSFHFSNTGGGGGTPFGAGGFNPGMFFGGSGVEGMDFTPSGASGFGSHKQQDPPVEHALNLTLEELYQGCTKRMKISRKILNPDGTTSPLDKVVSIDVKPGWKAGTKITFSQEGDQSIGRIPADIVFVVKEKPHAYFKREGNDLRHTVKLPLRDALCGRDPINIPAIDKRFLSVPLTGIVTPNTERRFPGEGMPHSKHVERRGDLIVNFDILFPTSLPENSIKAIKSALPSQ